LPRNEKKRARLSPGDWAFYERCGFTRNPERKMEMEGVGGTLSEVAFNDFLRRNKSNELYIILPLPVGHDLREFASEDGFIIPPKERSALGKMNGLSGPEQRLATLRTRRDAERKTASNKGDVGVALDEVEDAEGGDMAKEEESDDKPEGLKEKKGRPSLDAHDGEQRGAGNEEGIDKGKRAPSKREKTILTRGNHHAFTHGHISDEGMLLLRPRLFDNMARVKKVPGVPPLIPPPIHTLEKI
jgi:hypothetical protein